MSDMPDRDPKNELDQILEELSYEVTGARSAGMDRPEDLRAALRKARALVSDADALVQSEIARQTEKRAQG